MSSTSGVLGIVNDVFSDSASIPAERINKHVNRIQSTVGSRSGEAPKTLPKSVFDDLVAESSSSSDFKAKVAQVKDVPHATAMLEVLHGVVNTDDATRTYFATKRRSSSSSSNSALLQKLMAAVGGHLQSTQAEDAAKKRNSETRPFPQRVHLTLDFLPPQELLKSKVGALEKIPASSQESAIVQDLLYCLIGIEGVHVKPAKDPKDGALRFIVDRTLDASLKELLDRITPLCGHYSTVVRFAEERARIGRDKSRVNQALAGALFALLKDYHIVAEN